MVELCERTVKAFLDAVYHQGIPEDARLVLTNTPQFNNGLWHTSIDDAVTTALKYREHSLGCCIALRKASVEQPGKRGEIVD